MNMSALFKMFWMTLTFLVMLAYGLRHERSEEGASRGEFFGGHHGTGFDDKDFITATEHRRISKIAFYGCTDYGHPTGMTTTFQKDGTGPTYEAIHGHVDVTTAMSITMAEDEYITDLWFASYGAKHGWKNYRTRIASVAVKTNKGQEIKRCGSDGEGNERLHSSSQNGAVLYFTGATGEGIDSITPYWLSVAAY